MTATAARHTSLRPALDEVSQRAITGRTQTSPDEPALIIRSEHESSGQNAPGDDQDAPEAILWAALSLASEEGISVAGLMAATGMGRRWVYYRLRELADTGRAIQTVRGNWRTIESGGDAR